MLFDSPDEMVKGFYYRGGVLFKADVGVEGDTEEFYEEGRRVPAMLIEDRGDRFLRCVVVLINVISDFCGLSWRKLTRCSH